MICLTLIITLVKPASKQWCKNIEFRYGLASLSKPNEIFESPNVAETSGCLVRSARIASIVFIPASRYSSSPEPKVNVSTSKTKSSFLRPWRLVARSIILSATSSLFSTVFAIPTSSIVRHTREAPYFLASLHTSSNFSSPSSRFTELRIGFPPICLSAVSSPDV